MSLLASSTVLSEQQNFLTWKFYKIIIIMNPGSLEPKWHALPAGSVVNKSCLHGLPRENSKTGRANCCGWHSGATQRDGSGFKPDDVLWGVCMFSCCVCVGVFFGYSGLMNQLKDTPLRLVIGDVSLYVGPVMLRRLVPVYLASRLSAGIGSSPTAILKG